MFPPTQSPVQDQSATLSTETSTNGTDLPSAPGNDPSSQALPTEAFERIRSAVSQSGYFLRISSTETVIVVPNEDDSTCSVSVISVGASRAQSYTLNQNGDIIEVSGAPTSEGGIFFDEPIELLRIVTAQIEEDLSHPVPVVDPPAFNLDIQDPLLTKGIDPDELRDDIAAEVNGNRGSDRANDFKEILEIVDLKDFVEGSHFSTVLKELTERINTSEVPQDTRELIQSAAARKVADLNYVDAERSAWLTQLYQEVTGNASVKVIVADHPTVAEHLGDGTVVFSSDAIDYLEQRYPHIEDQEAIVAQVLEHEYRHHLHGDSTYALLLEATSAELLNEWHKEYLNGEISTEEYGKNRLALYLAERSISRRLEERADPEDGLSPEVQDLLSQFPYSYSYLNTHPPHHAR